MGPSSDNISEDHDGSSMNVKDQRTTGHTNKSKEDNALPPSSQTTSSTNTNTTEITPDYQNNTSHGASNHEGTYVDGEGDLLLIKQPDEQDTSTTEGTSRKTDKHRKPHGSRRGQHGDDEDDASHNGDGDRDEGGDGEDDDHEHREGLCEGESSSQHSAYIQQHLEELQKKCDEFHECTIELYKAENFHRVLAGELIQLKNICGLMYPDGEEMYKNGNQSVACSLKEQEVIRQDIGRRLSTDMAKDKSEWKQLNECLKENRTADESDIDTLCGRTKKETSLCGNGRIHNKAEEFFNHEMEHLHCSCAAIRGHKPTTETTSITVTPGLPRELGIAVGGGVLGLIILLLFLVIVLFIKNRKLKARFERHRVQYVPSPNAEGSDIYEEITDAPQGPRINNDESSLPSDSHQLSRASSLPERDVTAEISLSRNNLSSPGQNKQECGNSLSDYVNRMELTDNAEGDRVNSPGDDGHAHLDHIPDYDDMLELTDNAEGNRVNTTEDDGHAHLDPLPYVNTQGPTGSAEGDKVDSTGDDGHARPDHIPDYFDMLGLTGGTEGDMVYSTLGRQSNP